MRTSMQFIPASSPRMVQNAFVFGATSIIFDLEDAVTPMEKDSARILLKEALDFFEIEEEVCVRCNPASTEYFDADINMLKNSNIDSIMLPMATNESVDLLTKKLKGTDIKIVALIETCQGVEEAYTIAHKELVDGILLGGEDLAANLGAIRTKSGEEILYSRGRVVNACRAAKIDAIDTPFTDTDDVEGLIKDTKFAKQMGFTGKACINPRQITTVNEVLLPTKKEIDYAQRIIIESENASKEGLGVFAVDGKMIDAPIIKRAQNVLNVAKKAGLI